VRERGNEREIERESVGVCIGSVCELEGEIGGVCEREREREKEKEKGKKGGRKE